MSSLSVIVLAAGSGTRMKSATPKVLHTVGGIPMIQHVLSAASAVADGPVVAVLGHAIDQVRPVVERVAPHATIAVQDATPGTGRAVECGLAELGSEGDVLIVSGDVPLLGEDALAEFVAEHRAANAVASVLTANVGDPTGYGRIVRDSESGRVVRIVEHRDATDDERAITEINSGTYIFEVGALRDALAQVGTANAQGEKYLTDVIALLAAATGADARPVSAATVTDNWLVQGVNDRVQLAAVEHEYNARIIRAWQYAGVTVKDAATTWIDATVTLEPDVTILPGTHLAGTTAVASGATIGPDTTLVDTVVGERAAVNRTQATESQIGDDATVGPFTFLRKGSVLGPHGKIGAFCEVKNASIGAGSKVPHLSYVGDAEVGEGANIGAGTIFANYDGVNKHRSVVGSHVRTGAHNVFVAPVRIGDGAYTGAGTVVRNDVAAGALSLSVSPQRSREGWVFAHRAGTAAADAALAAGARPASAPDNAGGESNVDG